MGICVSCGEYAIVDCKGQCLKCHRQKKTIDRWERPLKQFGGK